MTLPVQISEKALEELTKIFHEKKIPSHYALRIGVRGSGCSGVQHYLGFDTPSEKDQLFELDHFQVVIEKKDFMHLIGMSIDFVSNEHEQGFVFS